MKMRHEGFNDYHMAAQFRFAYLNILVILLESYDLITGKININSFYDYFISHNFI